MVTFIFFVAFAVVAIALLAAHSANQRKRAVQSNVGVVHYRQSQYPPSN